MSYMKKFMLLSAAITVVCCAVYFVTPIVRSSISAASPEEASPSQTGGEQQNQGAGSGSGSATIDPSSGAGSGASTVSPTEASSGSNSESKSGSGAAAKPASKGKASNPNAASGYYGTANAGEMTSYNKDGVAIRTYVAVGAKDTMIAGETGILPTGSKFFSVEATKDSATFKTAVAIMSLWRPEATVAKVFDFNIMQKTGAYMHEFDGVVTMSVPVPEDLVVPEGMVLKVYVFNDDGTITACDTLIDAGRVVWGTRHCSTFAFVIEKPVVAQ